MELYSHQEAALSRMSNGCILKGGVGTGKTFTALNYYVRNESPRHLYIITTAKKRDDLDWEKEGSYLHIPTTQEERETWTEHGLMHVDSWNNIPKYKHIVGAFFIFDEQKTVGTGAWSKAFKEIARRNHWIMVSATPGDTWMDYMQVFIANGFYRNQTEFKDKHCHYTNFGGYPKLERFYGVKKLEELRDRVLVEMDFERATVRHIEPILVDYDRDLFKEVSKTRQNPWTGEPFQNASGYIQALRRVCGSSEEKLKELDRLWDKHPRLIVFYNYDWELEMLREYFADDDKIISEYNGHKHEDVPEGDAWMYLVNYMAGAEAWNCITTNAMVMFSQTYSYKQTEQAYGRIDRMNTPFKDLYYYILKTNSPVDRAIDKALYEKKDFNERVWLRRLGIDPKEFEKKEVI